MDFKRKNIAKIYRNTELTGSGSSGSISNNSSFSGESGLPYNRDDNGNYVITGNTIWNGTEYIWKTEEEEEVLMILNSEGLTF